MASKVPQKLFNIKQKLTSLTLRINKVIKHKVLSKSRNALIITSSTNNNPVGEGNVDSSVANQGKDLISK